MDKPWPIINQLRADQMIAVIRPRRRPYSVMTSCGIFYALIKLGHDKFFMTGLAAVRRHWLCGNIFNQGIAGGRCHLTAQNT